MKKLLKLLFGILKWFVILSVTGVLVLRWATPQMPLRTLLVAPEGHRTNPHEWTPLEEFPAASIRGVYEEDPSFWVHDGFLPGAVRAKADRLRRGGRPGDDRRTVSQQVAGVVFTLGTETWLQEGLETWYTVLIEAFWGKRHILEAYLNLCTTERDGGSFASITARSPDGTVPSGRHPGIRAHLSSTTGNDPLS